MVKNISVSPKRPFFLFLFDAIFPFLGVTTHEHEMIDYFSGVDIEFYAGREHKGVLL